MAKNIRTASVDEPVQKLIDNGADVNSRLASLALEDKGIKAAITDAVRFEDGETSVRIAGSKSKALLSRKTKFELKVDDVAAFDKRYTAGEFKGVVKRSITIDIGPTITVAQVAAMVKALGGQVEAEYSVEGKSVKDDAAKKVVKEAGATESITTSVTYENE